ncbi:DNA polymerase III subunit alpha [Campylobacter sp. MIT 12-8780]|uniref:DNA polymerase III subunit alpha n=1 Tax=unclassified Campylobacter TaxID=2593542 RepID=UPI00115D933A|nr:MULTISPECIES: DNA polymerase III subunit alpha [unclassified Campylobacter]NDJ26911.1 DNA polymerase III subunit alpha [Campylobacter sp. MIT 19-121]TQR41944.1 DNA polymerase III subunit alpha [Campylobacter sp. MIT 12-8780]
MSQFTHLHLHTEYSLLDGANKLKELAKTLKAQGATSVAMTDHGNMFGAIDFYQTMKKEGLKPIIGLEAYIHNGEELNDKSTRQRFHLCLYAKNEIGYQNLMYLSSQSYIKGLYYYPRINKKILKEHSEGLICSSACLQGEVNWHLNTQSEKNQKFGAKGYEAAKEVALWYKEVFKDDFYLELMRHGIGDQLFIDDQILRLAKELDIKVIATNDTHYTFKDRAAAHEALMCVNMGVKLNDPDRLRHSVHEFYVKSSEQMNELFADLPDAIANTQEIADKCNLELNLGNPTPPNFKFTREYAKEHGLSLPEPELEFSFKNDDVVFEHLCKIGLDQRLEFIDENKHEQYKERLAMEVEVIKNMKFSGYMLIVHDFIAVAKSKDIPVGPGRGSAAGSLVSYALKITDLDPLPYNLLFERFLNPERVSMPDIDVDFCQDRRDEVIDYVIDKYGFDKVAQVITFGKMLAKGVIRDVARVLDISIQDGDELAKLVPEELKITLEDAYAKEPKIKEFLDSHAKGKEWWEFALALEGLNRHAGVHAAGLVISNESLWKKTPLFRPSKNDEKHLVTQYSKDFLEDVDLIKFDFLGLKTLTVVDNAVKLIKQRFDKDIIWEKIDLNDKKTYETIQSGNTLGIFQIESGGMQALNSRLRPDCFEDLIAVLALYRPGPLESGMVDDYIDIKHGRKKAVYAFEDLKPILEDTYGVIVYQEQVMQIVQKIGGFSLGGADNVRRAMGKKKKEILDGLKAEYLEGAKKQGYDAQKADDLFELILKFAEYGFNKSHSAAYALIAFQTAYLKTYYPSEFMAALLTSEQNKVEKVAQYIEEMKRMNIKLLPPSINKAQGEFKAIELEDGSEAIVYGLGAIKSVGTPAVTNLMSARPKEGFKDIDEFMSKIDPTKVNKRTMESLIKVGAFDEYGFTRRCLIENLPHLCENSRKIAELKRNSASSLFGIDEVADNIKIDLKNISEYDLKEKLDFEKDILGIYVSAHPLDEFSEQIAEIEYYKSLDFENLKGNGQILCVGRIEDFKAMMSKNGKRYAKMQILDFYSSFDVVVFEKNVAELEEIFKDEKRRVKAYAFVINYRKDESESSFMVNEVLELEDAKKREIKAKVGFRNKYKEKEFTQAPKEFENMVLELDLSKLNKDIVYEIHELARKAHDPSNTEHKKLVLKVRYVGSCLLYNTGFVVSNQLEEQIKQKCV